MAEADFGHGGYLDYVMMHNFHSEVRRKFTIPQDLDSDSLFRSVLNCSNPRPDPSRPYPSSLPSQSPASSLST